MLTHAGDLADETIIASRTTNNFGRILLLRREPSRYGTKPAFGIRGESGRLRDGMWWQRENSARTAFAAVN